jgi:hypothetical protein
LKNESEAEAKQTKQAKKIERGSEKSKTKKIK